MAGNSISKTAVWLLLGLLILGLGGFGVTSLSGTIRSVGSVGDTDIGVNEYARALQTEINALQAETRGPVSFAQARAAGIDRVVLSRLVSEAALTEETAKLGISIGDRNLRDQILDIPGFQGLNGEFDREAYNYALQQAGLNEAAFEADVRAEASRTLLQGAVIAGVGTPDTYIDTLMTYIAERRDISFAILERADLVTGLAVPTEEDLKTYHQAHLSDYTSPEIKRITYAWLTPDMIIDTVDVDEDALREAFDTRIEEFVQPERRLVERLAFADRAAAEAAKAEIDAGSSTFETLVEARGLELSDIDLGDVTIGDLETAGTDVFAAEAGDVVGPLDSSIGPALFRINAILQAQETTFEDAQPVLRDELAGDRARRVIDGQIEMIDDLLAGGATIEDLAAETEMELGQIDWHASAAGEINGYSAFQTAAAAVQEGDYAEVVTLEDGGMFALRMNEIVAPAPKPLDEVREDVSNAWTSDAVVAALTAQAETQVADLETGTSFQDLGMTPQAVTELTRQGFQPGTPPEFIETVFGMDEGTVEVLAGNGRIFVLHLQSIQPPAMDDPDVEQLRTVLQSQAAADVSQDLFQALADDIRTRSGIYLDEQALNAVHANFQ